MNQFFKLLAFERQQCHKSSSLDRLCHGMLAGGRATGLATTNNSPMAIDQFFQKLNIFVVNIKRTWPLTVNKQRIFFGRTCLRFGLFLRAIRSRGAGWGHLFWLFLGFCLKFWETAIFMNFGLGRKARFEALRKCFSAKSAQRLRRKLTKSRKSSTGMASLP